MGKEKGSITILYNRRVRTAVFALVLSLLAPSVASQDAPKAKRLALVIGNSAYKDAPLPNPLNDADDMEKALKESGFVVIKRKNATLREMHLALREFGDRLDRQGTGLFYFAGHGMQVRGRNYLIPVDADIAREDEVAFTSMDLGAVMDKLDSAKNPVNLVILDACRNNPFGTKLQATAKGLAQVDAPPGTLIAFATAPGSTAADGGARNGLYTHHLVKQMEKPGAAVEEVFKAVRAGVRADSKNLQIPWESTSLESNFAFRAAPKPPPPQKVAATSPAPKAGAATPRSVSSPAAPPVFVPGDTWTYRLRNLNDDSERPVTMTVKEIRGGQVIWEGDTRSDLFGNFVRTKVGQGWRTYTPSTHMYVFPLTPGASFTLTHEQANDDKRIYDNRVEISIGGEEDVVTPAGKFRAVKIDRKVHWKNRDKPSDAGLNTWTYWYSAEAKRWIVAEETNVTLSGRQLVRQRYELEKMTLK
jgi:uncharacterized caspase-like protein